VREKILAVWESPWLILASVAFGAAFGKLFPEATTSLETPGKLYIALMQMTVLPIMCTAIIASLGGALAQGKGGRLLNRSILVFALLLAAAAALGLAIGLTLLPGEGLSGEAQRALGAAMVSADSAANTVAQGGGLSALFTSMISSNIVHSASQGEMLALMFFSIIIGLALGCLEDGQGAAAIAFCESLFSALCKIIAWIVYVLPVGVFSLVAVNVANLSPEILYSVAKLLGAFYLGLAALIAVLLTVCAIYRGLSPLAVLKAAREPMLIGLATESDYAPMPSAIAAAQKLGAPLQTAEIVVPIGANLFNLAFVLYYVVSVLFAAQLYGKAVGVEECLTIVIGAVLITMAGAELPMLSVIMTPLGLPVEALMVILTAIGPLVDAMLVAVNYMGNITATLMATDGENGDADDPATG
jgi:proton glutamate symport protein